MLDIVHVLEKNRLATGSVVQMLEAAVGQAGRGHRVTVVSRPGGDLEHACAEAGMPLLALHLRHEFDVVSAVGLRRWLRRHPTDIVHVHKGRAHAVALMAAAGLGPGPAIIVNRGVSFPLDLFSKWKYRHPRVAAVVCVAEAIRVVVLRSGGLRPERVFTVHSGTDLSRFDPAAVDGGSVRREIGLTPDQRLIAQVSVREWKGWQDLLEAFSRVHAAERQTRLLFVGCEPEQERDRVLAEARRLGLADAVLTLGIRRDMPEVLAACDVVVDASWAGTGITGTIREAMAMGRAVVATDCAGNRELVEPGVSGLLVAPREPEALADAIGALLADDGLRARMGGSARHRVEQSFSTGVRLDRLEALYHAVRPT